MPAAFAMLRTLQWVAFGGFGCSVMCTTSLTFSGGSGLTRDGRVASFSSPSTPFAIKRWRPRGTVRRLLPTPAAIARRAQSIAPRQNDPGSPNPLLRRVSVPDQPLQSFAIGRADRNLLDFPHRRRFADPRPFVNRLSVTEH